MKKEHSIIKKFFLVIIFIITFIIVSFYFYTLNYYKADKIAIEKVYSEHQNIENRDNLTIIYPSDNNNKKIGLIFYPGGKVEDKAYIPLLSKLSDKGITCVLVKMPFNLAVFNISAANNIYDKFPEIKSWYLSGHSLGGAMASSYAEKNFNKINGLILLASYPLNEAPINTISIYGSNDKVLDQTKLNNVDNKVILNGGNHAYFGNYGEQKGDGTATISREEQQTLTVDTIIDFISNKYITK